MKQSVFTLSYKTVLMPLLLILSIWFVFYMEVTFSYSINYLGIYPRTVEGLIGIVLSPFIHSDIKHLASNSIPLLTLSLALFYFYDKVAYRVLVLGVLGSGLLTWIIGRPSYHIGASGLVYVLFSFLFFKGVFTKYKRLVALSLVVIFCYGSMIWYMFPVKANMSWEGHLSGFIVGGLLALFINSVNSIYVLDKPTVTSPEDHFFLEHFDANGNFRPTTEVFPEYDMVEEECSIETDKGNENSSLHCLYNYTYKPSKKD